MPTPDDAMPRLVAEAEAMIAGRSRLLPTLRHVAALVAVLDGLRVALRERDETIQKLLRRHE